MPSSVLLRPTVDHKREWPYEKKFRDAAAPTQSPPKRQRVRSQTIDAFVKQKRQTSAARYEDLALLLHAYRSAAMGKNVPEVKYALSQTASTDVSFTLDVHHRSILAIVLRSVILATAGIALLGVIVALMWEALPFAAAFGIGLAFLIYAYFTGGQWVSRRF